MEVRQEFIEELAYAIDVVEQHRPVPAAFKKCFVCDEPAMLLVCGYFVNPGDVKGLEDGEITYGNPEDADFAEYIREASNGCPVILPVCEFHQNGSIPH
jgi:hypothetical protein